MVMATQFRFWLWCVFFLSFHIQIFSDFISDLSLFHFEPGPGFLRSAPCLALTVMTIGLFIIIIIIIMGAVVAFRLSS